MRVVLDTSAIIYLNDFRKFEEMITCDDVVKEVKDKMTSLKLSGLNLKVNEPKIETVERIKEIAKETGDLEKLSKTDLKVLALAKESNCTIISDDRGIQNVAEKLKIKYISIFSKKITRLIRWRKFCRNCNKFFERGMACSICGGRLARVPISSMEIK